ncbi:MetQ/NlpA family ABC transporter substrate-binding protein [Alteribacillus iranensis]|uniref:D-methionine transport system substrate-binding protein n=1 Tax=Alteribacillus iranensis TaxID=930128 RepID=A0A1I2EN30_9BACI|nr:MetQ/NlpA family ABC transporter substrate-binding protein [Alteribacillus iranensis]SFE94432.1 D-methionine transport system substrate-binding protein [Alteribacillus iranensis]
MKNWLQLLLVFALVLLLAACGGQEDSAEENAENDNTEQTSETTDQEGASEENTTLTVGASNVPHAEILEFATDLLAEEGIDLQIETFNDYVIPNQALSEEEIDANYFQHIPYLEGQIEEHGYDFVNAGGVHIEPIGVYSQEYGSLDELPDGAEVLMSSSVADHGRILMMLEEEGLITLDEEVDGVNATIEDIVENPKNLEFTANIEPAMLLQAYQNGEGDAVLINSNFAIDNGLDPQEDSITLESGEDNPYVNIIAVRSGDENNEEIQTLLEVLRSDEVKTFIEEEYEGAVLPVSSDAETSDDQ